MAHQGLRVVLVDGDMRRGTLHQVFGITREPGLSNLLIGAADLESCVQRVHAQGLGSLSVLPCGIAPPNPSELIGSQRMTEVLQLLQNDFDVVIFDSPPLNLVTDAAILATKADGVVLVGRAGHTEKGAVAYAADLLKKVHAELLGTILNDFNIHRDARYRGYGVYGYYYKGTYDGYGYGAGNGDRSGLNVPDRQSTLSRN
jgi:capsular exopolysaccharide synthesis family protein